MPASPLLRLKVRCRGQLHRLPLGPVSPRCAASAECTLGVGGLGRLPLPDTRCSLQTQPLQRAAEQLAQLLGVPSSRVLLLWHDRLLELSATPRALGLGVADILGEHPDTWIPHGERGPKILGSLGQVGVGGLGAQTSGFAEWGIGVLSCACRADCVVEPVDSGAGGQAPPPPDEVSLTVRGRDPGSQFTLSVPKVRGVLGWEQGGQEPGFCGVGEPSLGTEPLSADGATVRTDGAVPRSSWAGLSTTALRL